MILGDQRNKVMMKEVMVMAMKNIKTILMRIVMCSGSTSSWDESKGGSDTKTARDVSLMSG